MEVIIKALQQYALCIIAKDAGSRYPNPGRMLRNINNVVQGTNDLQSGGSVQEQMATLLTGLQSSNNNDAPPPPTGGVTIEMVTDAIDAAFTSRGL